MTRAEIRKLDRVFSKIIRSAGKCTRCGRINDLQCSHNNGRSSMSVRWEPLNALCLCAKCHGWYGLYRTAGTKWLMSYLGTSRFDELDTRTKKLSYVITVKDVLSRWKEYGWEERLWAEEFKKLLQQKT